MSNNEVTLDARQAASIRNILTRELDRLGLVIMDREELVAHDPVQSERAAHFVTVYRARQDEIRVALTALEGN